MTFNMIVIVLTHRFVVRSEPACKVQLRSVGDDGDDGHDGHQAQDQVDGDQGLVDGASSLVRAVPGYEVTKAYSGEGDEAVVEGVEPGPDGLHHVEEDGGEEEEEEEEEGGDQAEVESSDLAGGVEVTQPGVHQLQQEVHRPQHLLHQNTQQEESEGNTDEGVDHTEHFSC